MNLLILNSNKQRFFIFLTLFSTKLLTWSTKFLTLNCRLFQRLSNFFYHVPSLLGLTKIKYTTVKVLELTLRNLWLLFYGEKRQRYIAKFDLVPVKWRIWNGSDKKWRWILHMFNIAYSPFFTWTKSQVRHLPRTRSIFFIRYSGSQILYISIYTVKVHHRRKF